MCLTSAHHVILPDPAQAEAAPIVYGVRVLGADSARVSVDRGSAPAFELTVPEARRLAKALRAAVKEVSA